MQEDIAYHHYGHLYHCCHIYLSAETFHGTSLCPIHQKTTQLWHFIQTLVKLSAMKMTKKENYRKENDLHMKENELHMKFGKN